MLPWTSYQHLPNSSKTKFPCKLGSILDNSIICRPGLEWLAITIANAVSPVQWIRFSTPCQENGKGEIWASGKYLRRVKASEKATVNHQAEMKMVSSLCIIQHTMLSHSFAIFFLQIFPLLVSFHLHIEDCYRSNLHD